MQKNKPMLISIQQLQVESEGKPSNYSSTNNTKGLDGFVFLGEGLRPVTMHMECGEAGLFAELCTSRLGLAPWYLECDSSRGSFKKYYFVHSGTAASEQRHPPIWHILFYSQTPLLSPESFLLNSGHKRSICDGEFKN